MVFANGDLLLFKAVMDNKLAWLLEKHSEGVSKKVLPSHPCRSFTHCAEWQGGDAGQYWRWI